VGVVAGGLSPIIAPLGVPGAVALGAVANIAQYDLSNRLNSRESTLEGYLLSAGAGAVAGGIIGRASTKAFVELGEELAAGAMRRMLGATEVHRVFVERAAAAAVVSGAEQGARSFLGSMVANVLPRLHPEPRTSSLEWRLMRLE